MAFNTFMVVYIGTVHQVGALLMSALLACSMTLSWCSAGSDRCNCTRAPVGGRACGARCEPFYAVLSARLSCAGVVQAT